MKNSLKSLIVILLLSSVACAQDSTPPEVIEQKEIAKPIKVEPFEKVEVPRHNYGGWYCPDNLRGFPAVHFSEWSEVPVVNGRMPTKIDADNGATLIMVDTEKFPQAKPLGMTFPKLAYFESPYTNRKEIIIVIQGLNIDNDSVVGFRYLNGGNGSARLNRVEFIPDSEVDQFPNYQFATGKVEIKASPEKVRSIMTQPENAKFFKSLSSTNVRPNAEQNLNVNYHYKNAGNHTSEYADMLFGNFYVQNDYQENNFTEKFLILEGDDSNTSYVQYACGPFLDDFKIEKARLAAWMLEVKQQSEK